MHLGTRQVQRFGDGWHRISGHMAQRVLHGV